jgi:WD40 repeat protein
MITLLIVTLIAHAEPTPFTQLGSDPHAKNVHFVNDSDVFVQTEYHAGVWDTNAQQLSAFDTNQNFLPSPVGSPECPFIAIEADWAKDGAAVNLYDRKDFSFIKVLRPTGTKDKAYMLWSMSFNQNCTQAIFTVWPPDDSEPLYFYYMDVETGKVLKQFDLGSAFGYIEAGLLNRDGSKVLMYHENAIGVYDLKTKELSTVAQDFDGSHEMVPRFSPDGKFVIYVSNTGSINRYELSTKKIINLAELDTNFRLKIQFHPNDPSKFFVITYDELYEVDTYKGIVGHFPLAGGTRWDSAMCTSENLIMITNQTTSQIFNINTGEAVASIENNFNDKDLIYSCGLSPDGKKAVIGSSLGARVYPIPQKR